MSQNLTMRQAAAEIGLSYDRFRKVWPQLHADDAFPAPIRGKVWDAEAVAAWRKARSARTVVAFRSKPDPAPAAPPADAGRRARAALASLRAG